jgi:two-component system nitrate/nitrite sensor histidine kinase NarX
MPGTVTLRFAPLAGFTVAITIAYGFWRLAGGEQTPSAAQSIYWLTALSAALAVALSIYHWLGGLVDRRKLEEEVVEHQRQRDALEARLDAVVRLNKLLIDAQSEKDLIASSLSVIVDLTGAAGGSFLPFDEWGIALPPHIYGAFPQPVLRAWAEHLTTNSVRQACHSCTRLEAKGGENCELLGAPFFGDSIRIFCLPLTREQRMVGMLHLYLPSERSLSADQTEFIHVLLNEMILAVETMRLRNQELTTLRQLQMALGQKDDFEESVSRVVEGLREAFDFESAWIEIKAAEPRFPGLKLRFGNPSWLESPAGQALVAKTLAAAPGDGGPRVVEQYNDEAGAVLTAPICLSKGTVIGALIITADPETLLQRAQFSLVENAADQIAMLVENQRMQLDTHYRIVMQERIRLAREIHDSLAQTLAYLKLTATQMQSMLAHGDLSRLEQALHQSYQALSQAYLETREVIDNLRIAPKQSFADLLEQLALDFERSSGLPVETKFAAALPEVTPEIQAQLLRVVQEALSNVRRHASARRVQILLGVWNRQLQLEVCDDGAGFDADDVPEFSRHGLKGMRERAELIGADFQIVSQPGKGTCVKVQLPVKIEEKAA